MVQSLLITIEIKRRQKLVDEDQLTQEETKYYLDSIKKLKKLKI